MAAGEGQDGLGMAHELWMLLPMPCVVVDKVNVILVANEAAVAFLGYGHEGLRGRPLGAVLGASHTETLAHLRRCQQTKARTVSDVPVDTRGGEKILRLVSMPLPDGACQTILSEVANRPFSDSGLAFLVEASLRLGASLDDEVIARGVTELVVPVLADIATFDDGDQSNACRVAAAAHDGARGRLPDGPGGSWLPRVRDAVRHACQGGEVAVLADLTRETLDPRLDPARRSAVAALGLGACAIIPVRIRGTTRGVLTLYQASSGRGFSPDDLAIVRELARRVTAAFTHIVLHEELVELARAKDEFLSHVGHELRQPLASMRVWTHAARRDSADPAALAHALGMVERALARGDRLVADLVEAMVSSTVWSLVGAAPVRVGDLARDVVGELGASWRAAGLVVEVSGDDGQLLVWGDDMRLRQILTNLLSNAMRHARSTITIRVQRGADDLTVELVVGDDGDGIRAELVPALFKPFPPGRDQLPETLGIGLAVVAKLVALHGGEIRVDAGGGGRGATFIVALPRYEDPDAQPRRRRAESIDTGADATLGLRR